MLQQGDQILRESQEQGGSMRWTSERHPTANSALSDKAGAHRAHTQWAGCWQEHTPHQHPREAGVMNQVHPRRHNVGTGSIYPRPETELQASYLQERPKV